jgi:hypothetical protein
MTTEAKNNKRNQAGVKYATDCYRTFGGVYYTAWMSFPSKERIAAYRAAGLKCRRVGDELFMRGVDCDSASDIDRRLND